MEEFINNLDLKNVFGEDYNENNGMITKIWGPGLWVGLHTISFGYPLHPTEEEKINYYNFFKSLSFVLPCKYCRLSYSEFISTGKTKLTMDVMKNRYTLAYWLFLIHQAVNEKLGVDYGIKFEDVVRRYESYRSRCDSKKKGCVTPINNNMLPYKFSDYREYPIINIETVDKIIKYALYRGISSGDMWFYKIYKSKSCIHDKCCDINCKYWFERNEECDKIVKYMRKNGIAGIEERGEFKGMPTICECKLMLLLSKSIDKDVMQDTIKKVEKYSESLYFDFE